MKIKTILSILAISILSSCGPHEETAEEKQKRLSDEFNKNVKSLQDKLTQDTNQMNRDIKVLKANGQ